MQPSISFIVVILVACCHISPSVGELHKVIQASSNKSLVFLGTWGGKQYFGDSVERNHADAKAECEAANMKLVSIASPTELAYLKSILPSTTGYHWTSAQDANVFEWGNGGNVDLPFSIGVPLCMRLYNGALTSWSCGTNYYPLCQNA